MKKTPKSWGKSQALETLVITYFYLILWGDYLRKTNIRGISKFYFLAYGCFIIKSFYGSSVTTEFHYIFPYIFSREAYSAYSGALSFLHLSPNCRCPPSHPVVSSTAPSSCTQHPGLTTNRGVIGRLNSNTHPPSYSNDNLTNSYWLSDPTERMVNITYILSDKLIEVS